MTAAGDTGGSEPDRRVLLHSAGLIHPSLPARFALWRALSGTPRVKLEPCGGLDALGASLGEGCSGLVAYFHDRRAQGDTLAAAERFVREGGGLLAVHAASASFKRQPEWRDLLGGRFVGHGPVHRFRVEPTAEEDDVLGKLEAFEVRDELYRHEYDADVRIHLDTAVDGEREPVLWSRTHGRGRIAYFSLGHKAAALRHPASVTVLQRALTWTLG